MERQENKKRCLSIFGAKCSKVPNVIGLAQAVMTGEEGGEGGYDPSPLDICDGLARFRAYD